MSSMVYVEDRGGKTIAFRRDGDVIYTPSFPGNIVPHLPEMKMREDDVVIAGWMRSGTHWSWEMVSMLANRKAETIPKFKELHMFEYGPISILDDLPSPRVLNTHLTLKNLPNDMKTKPTKVIYLLRNPRDAALSWYRIHIQHYSFEYSGKWEDWLPVELEGKFDWGSWFDHVRIWEKDLDSHPNIDVYFLQYENMIKDTVGELRKISKFLNYNVSEDLLKEIAEKCHIEKMREDKKEHEWQDDGNLHYKHGKIGTWKSMFTVQQYEMFEKIYREKMSGSKFEALYKGPVEVL